MSKKSDRPERIIVSEVIWKLTKEKSPTERHIVAGKEVNVEVDTDSYCYELLCECGNKRYAKPNCLHEVTQCRICQHKKRLASKRVK